MSISSSWVNSSNSPVTGLAFLLVSSSSRLYLVLALGIPGGRPAGLGDGSPFFQAGFRFCSFAISRCSLGDDRCYLIHHFTPIAGVLSSQPVSSPLLTNFQYLRLITSVYLGSNSII